MLLSLDEGLDNSDMNFGVSTKVIFCMDSFLHFQNIFLEPGSKVVKEVIYIYNIYNKCITHLNASNQQARLAFNAKNLLKVFEVLLLHLFKRCL